MNGFSEVDGSEGSGNGRLELEKQNRPVSTPLHNSGMGIYFKVEDMWRNEGVRPSY